MYFATKICGNITFASLVSAEYALELNPIHTAGYMAVPTYLKATKS